MTPTAGSIVGNRFELVRELGRGSMGTVWLAEHLTLNVRCAVKFMSGEALRDPSFGGRFELEARAIAQLNSPHVVRVLDHDTHQGAPFIAMECLEGEDLGARIKRLGRLDASATYTIVSQVANGLAKAHAAGIVHRDLKPENIFIARDDDWEGGEVAKLLDFGVAKMTGLGFEGAAKSTQAGTLVGTPAYMSPEQARGTAIVDHRSDLWSLAVVAFECLTGKLPFDGSTLGDVFAKILFEPLPVPSKVDPACTTAFDRWWLKAATRNPEYRFANARDLADALGRALGAIDAPADVRDTLRAVGCEARPATTRRGGRARFAAAALVVAAAPLVATLARGGIEHRRPEDAASAGDAYVAAAAPGREPPVTSLCPERVEMAERVEASSAKVLNSAVRRDGPDRRAPARSAARTVSVQSRAPAPEPTLAGPPAPQDEIDFGI